MTDACVVPFALNTPFRHEMGKCWRVKLPKEFHWACDTNERPSISPLCIRENGQILGPSHSSHNDIAIIGMGRFSAWCDGWLYFSASDNTDPNRNGRKYTLDLITEASSVSGPAWLKSMKQSHLPPRVAAFNADVLENELAKLNTVASRYESDCAEIAHSDVVFLSIMCSGRTWVRYFLQTYIEAITGVKISLKPRSIPRTEIAPSICFTHDYFSVFESIPVAPWIVFEPLFIERPLLYLHRDPRDVAVSWFHYLRSSQPALVAEMLPSGKLSDFIDSPVFGVERIATVHQHFRSFFDRHPGPKLMTSYEDLQFSGKKEFKRILDFVLNTAVDERALTQAFHKSAFQEMQQLEITISKEGKASDHMRLGVDNWSGNLNDLKVRSGKIGKFREQLPHLGELQVLENDYPQTAKVLRLARIS